MPDNPPVEERVARLEAKVAEIEVRLALKTSKLNWIKMVEGTFKDRPEFDEVLRLGKELRDAEQEQYSE